MVTDQHELKERNQMQQVAITQKVNGLEVGQLFETIDAIKQAPNLADFKFRLANKWIDGARNRSQITNFYGVGQENKHEPEFVLDTDEPLLLLGTGQYPNPVEYLLHAVTACVTGAIVYHAAARGIHIQEIESRTEGEVDLRGFLGLDNNIRPGLEKIRIKFKIKADVPDERLEELLQLGPKYSPVFDTITRSAPVEVGLDN
jgi:uncharacterized OsmC-like protein